MGIFDLAEKREFALCEDDFKNIINCLLYEEEKGDSLKRIFQKLCEISDPYNTLLHPAGSFDILYNMKTTGKNKNNKFKDGGSEDLIFCMIKKGINELERIFKKNIDWPYIFMFIDCYEKDGIKGCILPSNLYMEICEIFDMGKNMRDGGIIKY